MEILWKIPTQFAYNEVGLTIGVFDGVHLGHQKIIKRVVEFCKKNRMTSVIITFEIHPRKILFATSSQVLTTINQKIDIISKMGVDIFIVADFEQEIMHLKATEFIEKVLIEKLKMKQMCVGTNFLFGKGKKGNIDLLRELSFKKGFKLHLVEPVKYEDELVSSTKIREYIRQGDVTKANLLLSRPHTVEAKVVPGVKRGRIMGYPTANLRCEEETLLPKEGVYVVKIKMDDEEYAGISNLGYRPTFEAKKEFCFEVHILDFKKEIYSKELDVSFIKRIRDEKPFKDKEGLIVQLKEDEKEAREIFKERVI